MKKIILFLEFLIFIKNILFILKIIIKKNLKEINYLKSQNFEIVLAKK